MIIVTMSGHFSGLMTCLGSQTGGSSEDNFPKRENNWFFTTLLGIHKIRGRREIFWY